MVDVIQIVQILAGLGLVTLALAYIKHVEERRCWRNYKRSVYDWIDQLERTGEPFPKAIKDDAWRFECERMLSDANFAPLQIQQMLEVSIIVAKGIAAERDAL